MNFRFLILLFVCLNGLAQTGQLAVNRITLMPDLPTPYVMRNWKYVAQNYDQLIFSTSATGPYLPLVGFRTAGINYPALSPILLQTYVGTNSSNQAEAINILPALVGASLVGIDKSNQNGINWVEKSKDFFNKANNQQVYLNGYSATSGGDWWYDVMPNVFFYQLYTQYPTTSDFQQQFVSVADQWLAAVNAMGASATPWTVPQMNYRAFNLLTMQGNADGVKQPEASGAIGWLLYHAYVQTGEQKYLRGAQHALEFLSNWNSNPSYELQLPYGVFAAAKMNAEQGTSYNISKMINWCFDRGALRGWGAIVGFWNGTSVAGLIGEANDGGNDYAFAMNGFQQAAALVPMIKYDKRFVRDIAKWTLNVANASRLFYRDFLPPANQDDYAWSLANDPNTTIAYEAIKQIWEGKPLYGTGDAKRSGWAQTNLGLYGSSHVGYLAALIEPTNVDGILLLDVNKTDFFLKEAYPTYAVYNPYGEAKLVTLTLPAGTHDVYDAISETIVALGVSGAATITVKPKEAVLISYLPADAPQQVQGGKLVVNNRIVDYHYGYDFTPHVRIKALAATQPTVAFHQQVPVYASVENAMAGSLYKWYDNNELIATLTTSNFTWTVPPTEGTHSLKLEVISGTQTASDSLLFTVLEEIPTPPVITDILPALWYAAGLQAILTCQATDDKPGPLHYTWTFTGGSLINQTAEAVTWLTPDAEGIYEVTCTVTDADNLSSTIVKKVLVKKIGLPETTLLAYYPLDGNVQDYSGNARHAMQSGVDPIADARGEPGKAYLFNSGSDIIMVNNTSALNFQDKITLSFWVKLNSLTEESFILSHGSWEQRWKVSVTPSGFLRWTVKTSTGTIDLDSSQPLALNQFYHFTVVYSGYSLELYKNGNLDTFLSHTGLLATTVKSLTFGRKEEGESSYYLRGVIDEVRMYNASMPPDEISSLPEKWNLVTDVQPDSSYVEIFPNPATDRLFIRTKYPVTVKLTDLNGQVIPIEVRSANQVTEVQLKTVSAGLFILSIQNENSLLHCKIIFH